MCDNKRIISDNIQRKGHWDKRRKALLTAPKTGLHPKRIGIYSLRVQWDWKGNLYHEVPPHMIDSLCIILQNRIRDL